jgi:hypothetical protein
VGAEFYVVGDHEHSDLGLVLRGTLFVGPLRIGDVFRTCEGPRTRANLPSDQRVSVNLGVVEIRFFQHLVHELDEGHGAELVLVGEGGAALADGVVLHTAPVAATEQA